jgi:NitT/TauT family transport system substrate-binding protein
MRRSWLLCGAAVLAAVLVSVAVPARAADQVTLLLNWFQLADHSPFYLAKKKGYFDEEGIDLTIVRGQGSGDTATKIELEQAEFGISDAPTVITAISKGADLLIVGMVYDKAANNVFFYKDAGIDEVKDLAGKAIAAPPGDSHRFLWPAIAKLHGVDPESVKLVNVKPEGKQAIVAARQADGAFDLYTSYPIWQKVLGEDQVGNLLFADHGLSLYGHSYIVNKKLADENPELIRRFLRATYKGWRDTYSEREAAIDAMMAEVPGIDRDAYLASLDYVLDLVITERSREHGLGWILPDLMQQTIDITYSGGTMDKELEAADVFTNDFNSKIEAPK